MSDLSPIVSRIRLEVLIKRKRKAIAKLAQRLEDAELERQVLEAELDRSKPWPDHERLPSRSGEASDVKTDAGVDDPERSLAGAPGGETGRQSTTGSAPGVPPAASAEQPAPSGTGGTSLRLSFAPTNSLPFRAEPKPVPPTRFSSARGKRAPDETGKRYGKLVVIERVPNEGSFARWRCGCDCGESVIVKASVLRAGRVSSCPKCRPGPVCSVCGKPGHKAPTCPEAERAGTKRCIACQEIKPRSEFYTHPTNNSGLQSRCKACDNTSRVARSGGIPGNPPGPRRAPCPLCHSMPSRVEGPRCRGCGLEAEAPPRATDFTGGGSSNLARASS